MGIQLTAFLRALMLNSYVNWILDTLEKIELLKRMTESCWMRLWWFYLSRIFSLSLICVYD